MVIERIEKSINLDFNSFHKGIKKLTYLYKSDLQPITNK